MSGFKVTPNARPLVDPAKLAAFADGADQDQSTRSVESRAHPKLKASVILPWVGLDDKKRSPAFSMRFTAKELAVLKHVSETTPDSMHEFCLKAIRKAMDDFVASHNLK